MGKQDTIGRFWDPSQLVCSANAKPEEGEEVAVSLVAGFKFLMLMKMFLDLTSSGPGEQIEK